MQTYAQLLHQVKRICRGAARARHRQGRPHHDLHAAVSGVDRADAGDGAHRRDPLGRVRRLRRAGARRPHRGERLARWCSPPTSPTARARTCRCCRSSRRRLQRSAAASVERVVVLAARRRRRRAPRSRPVVGRRSCSAARARTSSHAVDGGQRAGLHPRDLRHDRQTEAGDPHPRRLSGPHRHAWAAGASA